MSRPTVAVVGGGAWGMALAAAAARTGETWLLSRRAQDGAQPAGVSLARDEAEVAQRARLVLLAVPSGVSRAVAASLGPHLDGRHYVVHGVRGLVGESLDTICDVVRCETPARRLGALGGPALASDLLANRPSVLVCASHYAEVTQAVRDALGSSTLRIYAIDDLVGLEWASALVGCMAIGMGYAKGIGLSPGLLAAVISRGVEEAARLAAAAGGHERTLLGLAGYGDLLASIEQAERPEVLLGRALASGKPRDEALREAGQRIEAVDLCERVAAWAERSGVRAPILAAIARGILAQRPSDALIEELMTGPMG